MTKKKRVVLIVDPALMSAETEAYNVFEDIAEEIRYFNGFSDFGLRYWLPKLGGGGKFEQVMSDSALRNCEVVGCISLGSFAHVSEERNHAWMSEFKNMLLTWLAPRKIPFLGICFAHQYLAWLSGWEVGGVVCDKPNVVRRYVQGERKVVLTNPRFALLLAEFSAGNWNANTAQTSVLKWGYARLRSSELPERVFERPLGRREWSLSQMLTGPDPFFFAHARHFQVVWPRGGDSAYGQVLPAAKPIVIGVGCQMRSARVSALSSAGYGIDPNGNCYAHDAIIHTTLPWFTVQTHPERPLTPTSRRFLRNFLLTAALHAK